MISPIIEYEQLKKIDDIEKIAYERLFENYLKYELKGDKKLVDIESTDQESLLKTFAHGQPVPGMIYTFIHLNKTNLDELQNYKTGKSIKFHDFVPILFCTSYNPLTKLLKGLNLNMLPPKERLKFFQAFFEHYKQFFERIEEKTQYNKLAVNKDYFLVSLAGLNPTLFKHFNQTQGALFEYAYRSYNLSNVRKFRMLEYEEWRYISFLNAQEFFKRANLDKIYQTYYDNKNKT
jgi:hypothetical protein